MDPMKASCFICGSTTIFNRVGPGRKKNFEGLKHLLTRLCEVLSVSTEVTPENWAFLNAEAEQQQFICCPECFELLKNVERVHEILVKTQQQLKYYLDQIQRLIVTSEEKSEHLESSLWNLTCFDFRTSVLNRFNNDNSEDGGKMSEEVVWVKKEAEIVHGDQEYNDGDNYDTGWNSNEDNSINVKLDPLEEEYGEKPAIFQQGKLSSKVTSTNADCPSQSRVAPNAIAELPQCSVTIKRISAAAISKSKGAPQSLLKKSPAKKRKIDLETLEAPPPPNKSSRRSSPRAAKQSAEVTLKQRYANSDTSDKEEDDNEDGDPKTIDDQDEYQENYSDYDHSLASEIEAAQVEPQKPKKRRRCRTKGIPKGPYKKEEDYKKSECSTRAFYPLFVADENEDLYLYRRQTFIRRTYTHLHCLAYQCTFETPWEFYPSFQLIKQHIEDKHRTRKHISFTPHPCLLCNILFANREKFYEHLKSCHQFLFETQLKAICESCLVHLRAKTLLAHAFKHKNEDEKAAAQESKQIPYRYSQNRRIYTCDFANCTKSFNDLTNLRRHKQSHLPKELRTDVVLCPECGLQLVRDSLRMHMEAMHHPEQITGVLVCKVCDKRFLPSHRALYESHLRYHEGDKPFLCTECGANFVSSQALNGHIRHNHKDNDTTYPCQWCDCIYTKHGSWRDHMRRKHADKSTRKKSKFYADQKPKVKPEEFIGPVQRFPCPECEVICTFSFTLKKHMSRKHGIGKDDRKVKRPLSNYRKGGEGAPQVKEETKHVAPQEIDDENAALSVATSSSEVSTSSQTQFGHSFN